MSEDIVKQLRDLAPMLTASCAWTVEEQNLPLVAADLIERQQEALRVAREKITDGFINRRVDVDIALFRNGAIVEALAAIDTALKEDGE